MRRSPCSRLAAGACLLLALGSGGALSRAAPAAEGVAVERWYEILDRGQKLGHQRVVWAPSTWEGKPTVHDTTTIVTASVRDMLGTKDRFETTTTIDLERSDDGTLWWQRSVTTEAERVRTSELTWVGTGYRYVERLRGEERVVEIPLDAPVMTDAEAALGVRARAGALRVGDVIPLRLLDLAAREARDMEVRVVGTETLEAEAGPVACTKVEERDPRSGASSLLWIDGDGAFVMARSDGGTTWRRTTRAGAEESPVRPAEHVITTSATPPLERVFTADRLLVDVHLQGDPTRPLPAFPDSPWSRVLGTSGDDDAGWVVKVELRRHDAPDVAAPYPIADPDVRSRFERDLEPTVLMPARHPRLVEAAKAAIGDAKDLRTAAYRLARYVFTTLEKESPEVQQASALEILEECRGDCSEHALLFVALCRAAGIPARSCSGYVNVGSAWGAHAWAEIWTGTWIGADPTTGEIGTAARYLFFGYSDRPDSYPGVVSARAQGRMRFVATRVEEGEDAYDLTDDPSSWYIHDRAAGRYVHVLAGIELRDVPRLWIVRMSGDGRCAVRAEGLRAEIAVFADQGHVLGDLGGPWEETTFAGAPARVLTAGSQRHFLVHSRRRLVRIQVDADDPSRLADLERYLAPTFAPRPTRP